ncbi:primary-amine oxidase [Crossiella sp. SN42]|uniref:primary-amine oxidase n=1 Tax=Crossiella sp. SN42 TaxID=2944808 RepID=UPI00207C2DEC|nr:primary-amine oxidase [Crossiella sp. SN42]MCO1575524.1 primary-amine oxidase [Crossiella sp. SN42]
MPTSPTAAVSSRHPADALTEHEIRTVRTLVTAAHPDLDLSFPVIAAVPPSMDDTAAFRAGHDLGLRWATVTAWQAATGQTYVGEVCLTPPRITSWELRPGVQPAITGEELLALQAIVTSDEQAVAALERHGITDLELLQCDPWTAGNLPIEGVDPARRIVRATLYQRHFPEDNGYAHPLHLIVTVDLAQKTVLHIEDPGPVPIPAECGNYIPEHAPPPRTDIRPLEIIQPEGPSFTVDDGVLTWHRWQAHVGFHPVDGLVLSDVSIQDGDRRRPVLHHLALAEMVVPYGDPHPLLRWRNAFDVGEYHLGRQANCLRLGCDCVGEILYLNAVIADYDGQPEVLPNAICIHEEDTGPAWRHNNFRWEDQPEVRRGRRLVISSWFTVGNYEYNIEYSLHYDGRIECTVKLGGIVQTRALVAGEPAGYGGRIAPALLAPIHQHFFVFRLVPEIDGPCVTVDEVDVVADLPGPDNPLGNAFRVRATLIDSEEVSGRLADPAAGRVWRVSSAHALNAYGDPTAYTLNIAPAPRLLADPESSVAARAAFATKDLWVTHHSLEEWYPAGEFPNQSNGGDGLPRWISQKRDLAGTAVTIWPVVATLHSPTPEDWPVMPIVKTGFEFKPTGFFNRNLMLDLPAGNSRDVNAQRSCH